MSEDGYVIADSERRRFRAWGAAGPVWTNDLDAALWFARQGDAEVFAKDDEDAWYIIHTSVIRRETNRYPIGEF